MLVYLEKTRNNLYILSTLFNKQLLFLKIVVLMKFDKIYAIMRI